MTNQDQVFVVCGAAGSGKTTVASYLQKHFGMHRVITHTTRAPRPGERDGVDYHFEDDTSMGQLHLLESVTYDQAQYGSSMESLEEGWHQGRADVIVLDTKGALTYHQALGDRVTIIFLTVSKLDVLVRRMTGRGDQKEAIRSRLKSREYQRDLHLPHYLEHIAHVIVNDGWTQTAEQLDDLVGKIVSV
ncbi:guanylate kinase [Limosilactobacillus panis]|uniref:Guanylate kinase n=1 Tax=Limosilactobacillus panis DSM 6035 TaxID=1423782 RepID=A0A0R1X987_9LACO|nr:AAA family ATPase [Limosilactobacillus panis]KRM26325.1 guanylate kinase [Limosilactobacillus panis DSM 6035]